MTEPLHTDDLSLLVATLPAPLQEALRDLPRDELLEIVLDLGRAPQARFPERAVSLSQRPVSHEDLDHIVALVGVFSADNRAGIEGTLHRISAIRNRAGRIVGLTLRVGRAVFGTIDLIRDLVEDGSNLLLLGRPGIGKTTKLREMARVVADDLGKRVVVVDTSNEIAGDGDIPHPAIGGARRMQVAHPRRQHAVMIEAVENHMPEVIVVDEIGTEAEALAARTIAERGVALIATAHGNTLENLVMNPTLCDLVGGVQTVTLGDEEARARGTPKTITERRAPPTFDKVVEIVDHDEVVVHRHTASAVDTLLRGVAVSGERRHRGLPLARPEHTTPATRRAPERAPLQGGRPARIYAYAVSRDSLERVIRDLRLEARTVRHPEQANMVVALRARAEDPRLRRLVQAMDLPLHLIKNNTTAQMRRLLERVFSVLQGVEEGEIADALGEVESAVERAVTQGVAVALSPRRSALRKLQHRLVSEHQLASHSEGSEPLRYLVIDPPEPHHAPRPYTIS